MLQVSVIIPTYNDDERLQKCITALAEQSLDSRCYEVIVVNNSTEEVNCRLPESGFKLLQEITPGSYAARNKGLEIAKGKIIAFTDSDCIPDREWLKNGLSALTNACADRIAGKVEVFPQNSRMTAVECYEKIFAFDQMDNARRGSSVTANLFVKREVIDLVGHFDSSLLSGGDIEWNVRASQAGFGIVYDEEAFVLHPARHSWRQLSKKIERTTGGRFSMNPAYTLSMLRSLAPPIEAGLKILNSGEDTRTKLLAFFIAYRIKLKKLSYLRQLRQKKAQPQRS